MNTIISDAVETGELPEDLRGWLNERELIELVFTAVQSVVAQLPLPAEQFGGCGSRMLLTLLTYCYATDSFASEDVAWAAKHEAGPRYIGAREHPDWQTIRHFRKAHRRHLERCLIHVMSRAVAPRHNSIGVDDPFDPLCAGETLPDVCAWANRKVQLAVIMDTANCD